MESPLRDAVKEAVDESVGRLLLAHREVVDEQVKRVEAVMAARALTLDEKISGLQWKWAAALAGGQVAAGLVAAFVSRSQPAQEAALRVIDALPLL